MVYNKKNLFDHLPVACNGDMDLKQATLGTSQVTVRMLKYYRLLETWTVYTLKYLIQL